MNFCSTIELIVVKREQEILNEQNLNVYYEKENIVFYGVVYRSGIYAFPLVRGSER